MGFVRELRLVFSATLLARRWARLQRGVVDARGCARNGLTVALRTDLLDLNDDVNLLLDRFDEQVPYWPSRPKLVELVMLLRILLARSRRLLAEASA